MPGSRAALLVATDAYTDATFSQLRAPRKDAVALGGVLADPEIGAFTVDVLTNQPSHRIRLRINEFFSEAARDDLVLLYFSGHGVKDEAGRLHLATTDTQRSLLAATAISAQFVREMIDNSPARKVVLWLDCCYAGAFPAGMVPKAEGQVDVIDQLTAQSGPGCAVMTASNHIQYAFERGGDVRGNAPPSVFTSVIVEGLRTGAADLNQDGEIDAAELYDYVFERVKQTTPSQTPTRNDQVTGNIYIAHSRRGLRLHPGIPTEIRRNLRSARRAFRLTAVTELAELLHASESELRTIAKDTLRQLATGQDPDVATAAERVLNPPPPVEPAKPTLVRPPEPPPPKPGLQRVAKPAQRPPKPGVVRPVVNPPIRLPARRERSGTDEVRKRSAYAAGPIVGSIVAFVLAHVGLDPGWPWILLGSLLALTACGALGYLGFSLFRMVMNTSVTAVSVRNGCSAAGFQLNGQRLIIIGAGVVLLWETTLWRRIQADRTIHLNGYYTTLSADGGLIITALADYIYVYDGLSFAKIQHFKTSYSVEHTALSPVGALIAAGGRSKLVEILNINHRNWVAHVMTAGDRVRDAEFNRDGTMLATVGDGGIELFSTKDWQRTMVLSHDKFCSAIAFSPASDLVAAMGLDKVYVWRADSGDFVTILKMHKGYTKAIAFSPDGSVLAHSRWNHGIQLWDTMTWRPIRTLIGHHDGVTSLGFSPDSRILVSTSYDRTVKLWQVK